MPHSDVGSALPTPMTEAVGRNHRIKVLFVATGLETGGAEMMLLKLLVSMDHQRFDPSVICLGGSGTPGARIALREELAVGDDTILIGLMGRFHAQKDHRTFLQAARLLSEAKEDLHFVLAGRGVDPQNRELAQLIERFRLNGRAHLLGERRDMPDLTAALDIATSTSSFGESFPNVIGEAMACGVPCAMAS